MTRSKGAAPGQLGPGVPIRAAPNEEGLTAQLGPGVPIRAASTEPGEGEKAKHEVPEASPSEPIDQP